MKLESSVFSLRCLFISGSSQDITIESSSSFNTKLKRRYPVQALLLVMQFCFDEVLDVLLSHCKLRIVLFSVLGGWEAGKIFKNGCLPFFFHPFCIEPDL